MKHTICFQDVSSGTILISDEGGYFTIRKVEDSSDKVASISIVIEDLEHFAEIINKFLRKDLKKKKEEKELVLLKKELELQKSQKKEKEISPSSKLKELAINFGCSVLTDKKFLQESYLDEMQTILNSQREPK